MPQVDCAPLVAPNLSAHYFVGRCIHIGGKPDPLALNVGLFNLPEPVSTWDLEGGDAQYMTGRGNPSRRVAPRHLPLDLPRYDRFSLEADLMQPHCRALAPRAYVADAFFIGIGIPEDFGRPPAVFADGCGPQNMKSRS